MVKLIFDTRLDEGREELVRRIPTIDGAIMSFDTVRTGGPKYHLMPDDTVTLQSAHLDVLVVEFGRNARVEP